MLAYPCNTITLGRLSCHLKLKGILGLKWYLPMPKSRHAERLKRKQSEILCFQPTQRAVKKKKKKKRELFRLSDNFLKLWQDYLLCWIRGLLYLLLYFCAFLLQHYSISFRFFFLVFSISHVSLQGPPYTHTKPRNYFD